MSNTTANTVLLDIATNPFVSSQDKATLYALLAGNVTPTVGTITPTATVVTPTNPVRLSTDGNVIVTQGAGNTTGLCYGCGKTGMVSNQYCRGCVAKGVIEAKNAALPTQVAVDLNAHDTAKPSNKGRKNANCSAAKCGKFVAKGEAVCREHLVVTVPVFRPTIEAHLAAQEAAKVGKFVTLEAADGSGYRIPADNDSILSLRGSFPDAQVIEIAKIQGVGVVYA